jgi:hypothetical protein
MTGGPADVPAGGAPGDASQQSEAQSQQTSDSEHSGSH